jgi:hypothetical protein
VRFYAGIGARKTPPDVLDLMTRIARRLCGLDFILRSGGAAGADSAFAAGAGVCSYIYLADTYTSPAHPDRPYDKRTLDRGRTLFRRHHPAPNRCGTHAQRLLIRNASILLGAGPEPDPVDFVVCWTPGAEVVGGTGHALRIATEYQIPVFNLADPGALAALGDRLTDAP